MSWLGGAARRGADQVATRWRALTSRRRGRVAVLIGLALVLGVVARVELGRVAAHQQPRTFRDSQIYLEIAAQPGSLDQLFDPKPLLVPAIYRAVGPEPAAIAGTQEELAFWAWAVLGATLLICLGRWRARVLGAAVAVVFLLAPHRVGWADLVLSESINDSLMALIAAAAIGLATAASRLAPGRRRTAACAGLGAALAVLTALWVVARDSNAVTALAAAGAAAVLWKVWRARRAELWAPIVVACVAASAGVALWSSRVPPTMPNGVSYQQGWDPIVTPRAVWPTIDNIFRRVLPDDEARAYFVDHGMPMGPDLMAFAGHRAGDLDGRFLRGPEMEVARHWIARHGTRVYLRWLVRHPIARADELVGHLWDVLAPRDFSAYMPPGWRRADPGHPVRDLIRGLTESEGVVLVLLLLAPALLRRPRAHPLAGVALCAIASGAIGAAAAYYGDAQELIRHTWGAGQQIVLGLALALLAWLGSARRPARTDEPPAGPP